MSNAIIITNVITNITNVIIITNVVIIITNVITNVIIINIVCLPNFLIFTLLVRFIFSP